MNIPKLPRPTEGASPQGAASCPQRRQWVFSAAALCVTSLALAGCESADSAQISAPYVVAIGQAETPAYSDGELTLYESQVAVAFPIRKPTGAEESALKASVKPYAHSPYLLSSDESIEVNYTVTNLDDQSHTVWLLIDPWNEFVRYRPGVTVVSDDETEPNLSGIELPILLAPLQRLQGNIDAQSMTDLAVKLDTAMAIMAGTYTATSLYDAATLLNHDFNTQNTAATSDLLLAPYVPTITAGLTGFDLGLQSYEPMNVAIEVTVNVIDQSTSGKILPPGTTTGLLGPPPAFLTLPGSM